MQENDRYRSLIETLLRHPAFTPFINDISKDPAVLGMPQPQPQMQAPPQPQQQHSAQPTPQPQQQQPNQQDMKPEFLNFDASQLQIPSQQDGQQQQVGLTMVPEENFSKLNINGFQPSMNFNNYNTVNAYAVTSVPMQDPVKLLIDSPLRLPVSSAADLATTSTNSSTSLDVLLAKLDRAASRIPAA
jgi:bZIP-type transcription factor MBZ1